MDKLLSARGAGKILGVSGATVATWCREGRVPGAFMLDESRWAIPESSLDNIDRPKMGRPKNNGINGNGVND